MEGAGMTDPVADVERAMIAVRRSQARRALVRLARERGTATFDQAVAEVLDAVEECDARGEPATVTALAAALGIDQPRASRLVARAVDQGMLRWEADRHDRRRSVLLLTESGQDGLDRAHAFRRAVFEEAMAGWPVTDRAEFARLLTAFVAGFTGLAR
jgi:DNA-binding MarR family transcriptional regulator